MEELHSSVKKSFQSTSGKSRKEREALLRVKYIKYFFPLLILANSEFGYDYKDTFLMRLWLLR